MSSENCESAKRAWKTQLSAVEKAIFHMRKLKLQLENKRIKGLARTVLTKQHEILKKHTNHYLTQLEKAKTKISKKCGMFSMRRKSRRKSRRKRR